MLIRDLSHWHMAEPLTRICGITVQCAINDKKGWERAYAAGYNIFCVTKALMTKMGEMSVREKASLATGELVKSMITKRCLTTLLRFYSTAGNKLESCIKSVKNGPNPPSCSKMTMLAAHAADRTSAITAAAAATQAEGSTVVSAATTVAEHAPQVAQKLPRRITYVLHNERGLINVFNRHSAPIALTPKCADITGLSHVQFTPEYLKHVSGIQITETFKKSGNVKTKISGLHKYRKNKMRKYLRNVKVHPETGVIQADVHYKGIVKPDNTFFPSSWTDDKILKKVKEALANQFEKPLMQENGRWLFKGITREKIKIDIVVEKTGEFVTTYPLYEL